MKAITCTQCGATIENVSERSVIVDCEYCGARVMLDPRPEKRPASFNSSFVPDPDFELSAPQTPDWGFVGIVGGAIALLPIILLIVGFMRSPEKPTPSKVYSAPSSPVTYSTPSSWTVSTEPVKPVPVVNYQPRVSWAGPNDMEYFADPEVDISSVAHLTSEEVEKTVFKNRIVKLAVVINTEGEIDTVETISGHPLLVAAATDSAKRSIFKSRSKPTNRVLTYTFRVLKD